MKDQNKLPNNPVECIVSGENSVSNTSEQIGENFIFSEILNTLKKTARHVEHKTIEEKDFRVRSTYQSNKQAITIFYQIKTLLDKHLKTDGLHEPIINSEYDITFYQYDHSPIRIKKAGGRSLMIVAEVPQTKKHSSE